MDVIHLVGSKSNLINCRIIVNCELVSDYAAGRKIKFLEKNIIVSVMSSVDCLLIKIVFS